MNLNPLNGDFIDIHTHCTGQQEGVFSISNMFLSDYPHIHSDIPVTVGFHPWHIDQDSAGITAGLLEKAASLPNVVGIGETGLDKVIRAEMILQEEIFRIHIAVSEKLKKPLVIHCVKAFQELIKIKKEVNPLTAWIVHGYHGSRELTAELVKNGFFFSVNEWVIMNPQKGQDMLRIIPSERLFLETDEYPGSITKLYSFIEELLYEDIRQVIFDNYNYIFKPL